MKSRTMLLLAFVLVSLAFSQRAAAATWQWTNSLPTGVGVTDLLPDGKGGVVVCFTNESNAYVIYLDKKGARVWLYSWGGTDICADYISKKTVIVTVATSGNYQAYEMPLSVPNPTLIASSAGKDYIFGPAVPTANKDSKGFFLIKSVAATGERVIIRYSYK